MTGAVELRRLVALRAYGAVRMLRWVQAALEDVEGAVEQGQYGSAAVQARFFLLGCCSVRSLAHGGEIQFDIESVSFDYYCGLSADELEAAASLAAEAATLEDPEHAAGWLRRLQAHGEETEALLGYRRTLPVLRTPEGAFGLLGIAREWSGVLDELGLPSSLPAEWDPRPADDAADG